MIVFSVRIFLYSILPLLLSAGILFFDRSANTRERRIEVPLIMLFGLGVAASGIASYFGHFFAADLVADSVGWTRGSPFQLEMAFANLAAGILGIVAAGRRDGFREATVIAVSVLGVGATIVHFIDIVSTGNLAPGNTIQNVANLIKPAFLIPLLIASRRAEKGAIADSTGTQFELWRVPLLQSVGIATAMVATAFAVGFAVGQTLLVSAIGTIAASAVIAVILMRSPLHAQTKRKPPRDKD